MIKVKWFGHSMWKISNDKISIITDPFNFIGYKLPVGETADVVLISHAHSDHNNSALICGDPAIVKAVGKFNIAGINIQTYHTYHDEEKGRKRGNNLLMKYVDDHKHQNSNEIELTKADFTTKRTITLNYE